MYSSRPWVSSKKTSNFAANYKNSGHPITTTPSCGDSAMMEPRMAPSVLYASPKPGKCA